MNQHANVAVTDEATSYDGPVAGANQRKQTISHSNLIGMFQTCGVYRQKKRKREWKLKELSHLPNYLYCLNHRAENLDPAESIPMISLSNHMRKNGRP